MGIEQNFNNNLEKAVKKQTPNMPRNSKFLLHQLVKNIDEVEDMLDSDNVVADYNVGELREVIEDFENEEELDEWVPGTWTNYSGYGKVKPAFNYKSQGPIPGAMIGSGYNFESDGPLGVSYFTESKKYNVGDLKQVIHSLKEDKKETESEMISEKDSKYCGRKLGKCCDGGDGHGCGKWEDDEANKKCTCSYAGDCCSGSSGKSTSSKGSKDVEKELNEGPVCNAAGKSGSCGNCGPDGGNGDFTWQDSLGFCVCKESGGGVCQSASVIPGGTVPATGLKNAERGNKADMDVGQEMGEATTTASSGAYSTPRFWAKDKKNQRFSKERWMPGAQYVKVKEKCKKFPYCNQGDINALEIWEKEIMRESAKNVSKKTGLSEKEVREKIEREIQELITRGFYKSPVTDLVGTGKMDTPIGKMFTMSGNKPKYES